MTLHDVLRDYLLFQGFEQEIQTLALYSVGIAVYGLFIYFFYENLSKRNLLGDRLQDPDYGAFTLLVRGIRYMLIFPVVTFFFFMLLSFSFFFLSGTPQIDQSTFVGQILLISMAVVTSVRITAYISQDTSHDIAKLLPLGLLGVYLVQLKLDVDKVSETVQKFRTFFDVDLLTGVVLRYFIFLIALEAVLRVVYLAVRKKEPEDAPAPAGRLDESDDREPEGPAEEAPDEWEEVQVEGGPDDPGSNP